MIKDPLPMTFNCGPGDREVLFTVHGERDVRTIPFICIDVVVVGEATARQCIRSADTFGARVIWAVNGSVNDIWFSTDILHNINFAAAGPANGTNIVTKATTRSPSSAHMWSYTICQAAAPSAAA